jgi:hypothetical protein
VNLPPVPVSAFYRRAQALFQGYFATVDPGTEYPAAAAFYNGRLIAASRIKVPKTVRDIHNDNQLEGERARQISKLIAAWILEQTRGVPPNAVVFENPQIYTRERSKGNPNKLIPLAMIGAGVASRLDVQTYSPWPHDWIGGIPKSETGDAWESPRGQLIHGRLSVLERSVIVVSHDALDAVGIGLWILGRLDKVYSSR